MKKTSILLTLLAIATVYSCNQKPAEPTAEEIASKVTERYGDALTIYKEKAEQDCALSIDAAVIAKLADTTK
jgi:translation initiation factor 2 alpha subunit (eIF-2alpha)